MLPTVKRKFRRSSYRRDAARALSIVLLGGVLSGLSGGPSGDLRGFILTAAAASAPEQWPIERWAGDERAPVLAASPPSTLARISASRP